MVSPSTERVSVTVSRWITVSTEAAMCWCEYSETDWLCTGTYTVRVHEVATEMNRAAVINIITSHRILSMSFMITRLLSERRNKGKL